MQSSQATKPTPLSLSLVFSIFTSPPSLPPSSRRVPFHHHPIPPFPFISERAMAAADLFPLPHHHAGFGFGFGFGGQSVHSPVFLPPFDPALPPSPRGKREAVKPKAVHTHTTHMEEDGSSGGSGMPPPSLRSPFLPPPFCLGCMSRKGEKVGGGGGKRVEEAEK